MEKRITITYQEALDLGFEREELSDSVWFDQHGYDFFVMCLKLTKRLWLYWSPETHTIELVRMGREEGNVDGRMEFHNMNDLLDFIRLFRELPEYDINEKWPKGA